MIGSRKNKKDSKEPRAKLNKKELGTLWGIYKKYIGPFWPSMLIGLLCLFVTTAASLLFPMLMRDMVNAQLGEISDSISEVGWTVGIALVLMAIAAFLRILIFSRAGEKGLSMLRSDLYGKLMELPVFFYEKNKVGDITSRITSDVLLLKDTLSITIAELFRQLVLFIGGTIFLFRLSVELSITMLAVFPIIIIVAVIFGKMIKRYSKEAQELLGESNAYAEESLHGIYTVKSFANETNQKNYYSELVRRVGLMGIKTSYFRGILASFIISGIFGSILLVMWRGAVLVGEGSLNFGDLVGFIVYTLMIGAAVGGIGDLFGQLAKAAGAAERISDLSGADSEFDQLSGDDVLTGGIQINDLNFAYPSRPDKLVLKDLSFNLKEGKKLALIGKSGSGKSTIANLIMRFYDEFSGSILIGERSVKEFPLKSYRKQIGIVPQDIFIFSGTIKENISYGNQNLSDDDIVSVCKKANAWEFIEKLPDGLDTILGERGINLSGGQKQRIAIARTLLKDPKLLILDEATSALDNESEHLVQEAINALMQGRTTIVIAHRLSTIKDVDHIMVLEEGQVIEQGSPEELLAGDGYYQKLLSYQKS